MSVLRRDLNALQGGDARNSQRDDSRDRDSEWRSASGGILHFVSPQLVDIADPRWRSFGPARRRAVGPDCDGLKVALRRLAESSSRRGACVLREDEKRDGDEDESVRTHLSKGAYLEIRKQLGHVAG